MTIKTEGVYTGEFLLSEASGTRSREEVVIAAGSGILKAGTFEVVDPMGLQLGEGTVGVPFTDGGLTFTLADGSTDFAVDDAFTLAVLANLGEYTDYDDAGTDDGRRTASGILFASVDATVNDVRAVGVMRDAEVIEPLLTGLDSNGRIDLLAKGIIIRP